ncbi:MAG TPA: ADP-ribosylglycohydrolase family protein [Clostridiaceae bacterium]|nr:ADP-ribosylglycohydrolase family protein [Clostridiaceae bacterium]
MIQENYLEKVYSGFLGMNIGIRLGAPVEPTIWTYERIRKTYGDITSYVKDYKNFAADDDANGPFYFLRALYDDAKDRELTPEDVGRAWLNYAREGVGMFWWGGYGVSTEHTAFLNLKAGIKPPQSGSIAQNGRTIAEQIGGQIFIDTWGLICPGDPEKAAKLGATAASVSHDGEGLNGARFFCAAIAEAFVCNDIRAIIEKALTFIPEDSTYSRVVRAVMDFYDEHPDDFRLCMDMLIRDWGYDKYKGVCHIIPNAGVCALAMMYGKGDFNRTVEIATMCGWDTDCNAGNVGTVLGVMCGLDGLAARYRDPINDSIVLSGVSGYLNIVDIPTYAKELALLGYRMAGEEAPEWLKYSFKEDEIYFDFELPGSTHNFRVSDPFLCRIKHSDETAFQSKGSIEVLFDRLERYQGCKVFYKPFYTRDDFSDERYMPVFSPKAYSGQKVSLQVYLDQWEGNETIGIAPFVRLAKSKKDLVQGYIRPAQHEWTKVEFTIPDTDGEMIDEVGIIVEGYSAKVKSLGRIFIDDFRIYGKAKYSIDFSKQLKNFGSVTPFSHNHGAWSIEDGKLDAMCCDYAQSFSGNYFARDYMVTAKITAENGSGHMLTARSQGIERGYHAGFDKPGKIAIYKNNFGFEKLCEADFPWEYGKTYTVSLKAVADQITLYIDGEKLLEARDSDFAYGMFGFAKLYMGRTLFSDVTFEEL